ncbi:MAG: ABC transporter permease [Chloroflexi bacterium]|nr:MAG: ABC transporter permease [Chloroflexota bacterium]
MSASWWWRRPEDGRGQSRRFRARQRRGLGAGKLEGRVGFAHVPGRRRCQAPVRRYCRVRLAAIRLLGAVAAVALDRPRGSSRGKPAGPVAKYPAGGQSIVRCPRRPGGRRSLRSPGHLDYFGAAFIGLVVFFLVFVITAVAFLRERGQGTLERLMASPLRRAEIVLGYMLGFTVLALVQSAEVLGFSLLVLHVHNVGNVALIFVLEALMAIAAVNLGIFLSMFARTEFQAVQFIPLVIVPQMLLAGIIFPVSTEPGPLQALSHVVPLTYAVEGLRDIMIKGADLTWSSLQLDFGVVLGFCILVILAGATTLRRRIA